VTASCPSEGQPDDSDEWPQDSGESSQLATKDGPSDHNHLRQSLPAGTESLPLTIDPEIELDQDASTAVEAQDDKASEGSS